MNQDEPDPVAAPIEPPIFEGDDGTTTLGVIGKVNNDDIRLAAYQDCGEVNSMIGLVLALAGGLETQEVALLSSVQNDLYDLTSDIGTPNVRGEDVGTARVTAAHIERLERACDHYAAGLEPHDGAAAVLPGGTLAAALLYQTHSVTQRAERSAWTASVEHPESLNSSAHRYLNRLATLLSTLAQAANAEHGNTPWTPMGSVLMPEDLTGGH